MSIDRGSLRTDLAGNSASAAVGVTRVGRAHSVAIIPSVATISVGTGQPLQLIDNFGRTIPDGEWVSDDPRVARVVTMPTLAVAGVGPGVTTVVAKSGALMAQIRVTVMDGRLPPGTVRWSLDPLWPGVKGLFFAHLTSIFDGPDEFTIDGSAAGGGPYVVGAVTEVPRRLWIEHPAIAPSERVDKWMGDVGGGALLLLTRGASGPVAIVRVGRPDFGSLWRYESAGRLAPDWAMDSNGTLYVSETKLGGPPEIIAIDGDTGLAKFRIPVRPSRQMAGCESIVLGPPTVPADGAAAFQFVVASDAGHCEATGEKRWSKTEVHLLRVRADGWSQETLLTDFQSPPEAPAPAVTIFKVIPDAGIGFLAMMHVEVAGTPPRNLVFRQDEGRIDSYSLPIMGVTVTGHRWAFTTDGHTLIAFDAKTGRVGWSRTVTSGEIRIIFAEERGGVLISTIAGQELLSADDGSTIAVEPIFGDFLPAKR